MWRAYFIETMTGRVGKQFEMSTNGRFDITLNGTETGQVTAQKSTLEGVDPHWMTPWMAGILVTLTGNDGVERPIMAGPITAPPEEYDMSLSFVVGGIRSVLKHRYFGLQDESYSNGLDSGGLASATKKSKVTFSKTSYGYMAQRIVQAATSKLGGDLPIRYVSGPEKTLSSGGHTKSYDGHDIGNNEVDKLLYNLSELDRGPDIMFRPEWTNSSRQYIRWAMYCGSEVSPAIPQTYTMVIDSTVPRGIVSELSLNTSGDHYATRAWVTGAGEGKAVAMTVAENRALLRDHMPLLEVVQDESSIKEIDTLRSKASALIDVRPMVELHATIDCADERSLLGVWEVGDKADLVVKGWYSIPDGLHSLRIVRVQGDFDTTHATIYFQEDQF